MATKSKRHIHKYHKVMLSFAKVWACGLPDCSHYMPQQMEKLVEGKHSICWGCGESFILDPISMRDDKPKCIDCSSGAKAADNSDAPNSDEAIKKFIELGIL